MKLLALGIALATLVMLGGTAWAGLEMRHQQQCAHMAVAIIQSWEHHIPSSTLDALIAKFDDAC